MHFSTPGSLDCITKMTGKHVADKHPGSLHPSGRQTTIPSKAEVHTHLGMRQLMGIHGLSNVRSCFHPPVDAPWKTLGVHMSHARFRFLSSHLHFCDDDKQVPKNSPDCDELFKLRAVVSTLQKRFRLNWMPSLFLSCDESLVPSRHRWLRAHHKDKPHKWGIEILALCDARTGCVASFCVNDGLTKAVGNGEVEDCSPPDAPEDFLDIVKSVGKSAAIVARLVSTLRRSDSRVARVMVGDRRFANLPMMRWCARHGFGCIGTTKSDRRAFPGKFVKLDKVDKKERGAFKSAHCVLDGVTYLTCQWNDNNAVTVVGTVGSTKNMEVLRRNKTGRRERVSCPQNVMLHNETMGGVDRLDQLRLGKTSLSAVAVFRRKSHLKLVFALMDTARVNALIWCRKQHGISTSKPEFDCQSAMGFMAEGKRITCPLLSATQSEEKGNGRFSGLHRLEKLDQFKHVMRRRKRVRMHDPATKQRHCVLCRAKGLKRRTLCHCKQCPPSLQAPHETSKSCPRFHPECFMKFHGELIPEIDG